MSKPTGEGIEGLLKLATKCADMADNGGYAREERVILAQRAQAYATIALTLATMQARDGVYR